MSTVSILPDNLPDVSWDEAYYQMGLDNWASIRDTVPDMISYFKDNIDLFVGQQHDRPCRILSVGCGSGLLDLPLLNLIAQHSPKLAVHYEGIDPSASRLNDFRTSMKNGVSSLHNITLFNVKLEDYPNPVEQIDRFDLILCARVLYYMHDQLDATFTRLFQQLREPSSGKILVFQQSPSGLAQIAHIVGMTHQSPVHACNTYHLKLALDRISQMHTDLHYRVLYLDKYTDMSFLDQVRSNDSLKRDKAINLLSFILGKNLTSVNRDLIEQAVARILSAVTFEAATGNQYIMFQPIGVIIVENRK